MIKKKRKVEREEKVNENNNGEPEKKWEQRKG